LYKLKLLHTATMLHGSKQTLCNNFSKWHPHSNNELWKSCILSNTSDCTSYPYMFWL